MEKATVRIMNIEAPIKAVGKAFTGDYANSSKYITEIQNMLTEASIAFIPNKAIGVYYDNPETTKTDELKCFQGVFLMNDTDKLHPSLKEFILKGNFLYTKVTGDPSKIIYEGYNAIFDHIRENGIALKSNAGFQVSTFENNALTIEIYMEVL